MQPMQPMMGMPGMQMAMPQQQMQMGQMAMAPMAMGAPMGGQMGQMTMAPMAMGTPMGMVPAMGMMPVGVPMMAPMGMMGAQMPGQMMMQGSPMMMMPGQMSAQMPGQMAAPMGIQMSAPMGTQMSASTAVPAPVSQPHVIDEATSRMAALSSSQKASADSGSRLRRKRDDSESDEEGRGRQALRNVGRSAAQSKEARRSEKAAGAAAPVEGNGAEAATSAASEPSERKRCHLHMKPNGACKICRRIKEENAALDAGGQSSKPSSKDVNDKDDGGKRSKEMDDANKPIFRSSPMLKDQILKSSYFKSLLDITSVEGLIEEITEYADCLDVYNPGSATIPSCFICQVYRLFTFPHAEDELPVILDSESAKARCVGFIYVRFVYEPAQLWTMLEEHLFDDMELKYQDTAGKAQTMSIGEYVEALLTKEKYFGSPLPRIPVKVRQQLDERLAPLPSYRKRMEANRQVFNQDRAKSTAVEVCVDSGKWLPGKVVELFGRSSTFVKVRVKLEDGREISSHLGKVVLRDSSPENDESSGSAEGRSDSEGAAKKKRKKQQNKKKRGKSPDWSRFKGKSHVEMLEELRERAKEDAVGGHVKSHPRRPLTFEGFATKFESSERRPADGEARPSYVQPRAAAQKQENAEEDDITRRLRRQQEDERQRQQQAIFEKYGKQAKPGASSAYSDVDKHDVLRLG